MKSEEKKTKWNQNENNEKASIKRAYEPLKETIVGGVACAGVSK